MDLAARHVGRPGEDEGLDDDGNHVGGTDDVDYDALLARAGLRLVRGGDAWTLEEIPDATPAQRAVREGWATGRCG